MVLRRLPLLLAAVLSITISGCQLNTLVTPTVALNTTDPIATVEKSVHVQSLPPTWTPQPTQPTPTLFPTQTPLPAPLGSPEVIGFYGFPDDINPLTGLPPSNVYALERRPVMVKVSNYPPSVRPQAGLSFADIVFEYYIGNGENRFLATYYGQDATKIGSVRSGRLVDSQLVSMYQGILVYGSADPRVDEVIETQLGERAISHLEAPCPVVCGGETHSEPWVYANSLEVTRYVIRHNVDNERPVLNGMLFDKRPPNSDQFAIRLGVEYSSFDRGEWRYNPTTGLYERWVEEKLDKRNMVPLTDQLTGAQLAFANVIVLFAEYTEYNPTLHDIAVWDVVNGQRAVFFRDGVMTPGSWRAASHEKPIQFFNQWGLPYLLKPGNTWIVITGLKSDFVQTAPGVWELYFNLP